MTSLLNSSNNNLFKWVGVYLIEVIHSEVEQLIESSQGNILILKKACKLKLI